jgi:hypothetical protein
MTLPSDDVTPDPQSERVPNEPEPADEAPWHEAKPVVLQGDIVRLALLLSLGPVLKAVLGTGVLAMAVGAGVSWLGLAEGLSLWPLSLGVAGMAGAATLAASGGRHYARLMERARNTQYRFYTHRYEVCLGFDTSFVIPYSRIRGLRVKHRPLPQEPTAGFLIITLAEGPPVPMGTRTLANVPDAESLARRLSLYVEGASRIEPVDFSP